MTLMWPSCQWLLFIFFLFQYLLKFFVLNYTKSFDVHTTCSKELVNEPNVQNVDGLWILLFWWAPQIGHIYSTCLSAFWLVYSNFKNLGSNIEIIERDMFSMWFAPCGKHIARRWRTLKTDNDDDNINISCILLSKLKKLFANSTMNLEKTF